MTGDNESEPLDEDTEADRDLDWGITSFKAIVRSRGEIDDVGDSSFGDSLAVAVETIKVFGS